MYNFEKADDPARRLIRQAHRNPESVGRELYAARAEIERLIEAMRQIEVLTLDVGVEQIAQQAIVDAGIKLKP